MGTWVLTSATDVPELGRPGSVLERACPAGEVAAGISKAQCLAALPAAGPVRGAIHEGGRRWLCSCIKELIALIVHHTCTHKNVSGALLAAQGQMFCSKKRLIALSLQL